MCSSGFPHVLTATHIWRRANLTIGEVACYVNKYFRSCKKIVGHLKATNLVSTKFYKCSLSKYVFRFTVRIILPEIYSFEMVSKLLGHPV